MLDGETTLWSAWAEFMSTFRQMDIAIPSEWGVGFVSDITFQEVDTSRMSLCPRIIPVLRKSLKNLKHYLQCPEPTRTMVFGSSRTTRTTSILPMRATSPLDRAVVHGSSILPLGEDGEDLDFDEEISSLTSLLSIEAGSLDITLQTAESQYSLQAEKKMEDCVFDLKIYRYVFPS